MNITMRQLQVFQTVAKHLNFTRAAAELHLTQPAVSMQVKQLEENLGLPLFEQLGKRIHLTEAGQEMLGFSYGISQQLDAARDVFAQLRGLRSGTLRIAVPGTAHHFVTRFLAEFRRRYPLVKLQLDIANRQGLLHRLEINAIDLVIMGKPPDSADLIGERFMDNPLVVIAPPEHPLVGRGAIDFAALLDEDFIVREPGSGTRIAIERFFSEHRLTLRTSMEMASNETLKQAVAAGLGLGIVSIHTLGMELELRRLAVLDVEHFPIMRHWYITYRNGKRLSPIAEAFRDFVLFDSNVLWNMPIPCSV